MQPEEGFETLARRLGVSCEARRVDANHAMPNPEPGLDHWWCEISSGVGSVVEVTVSFGADAGGREPVAAEVLALASADVASARAAPDAESWIASAGGDPGDPGWVRAYAAVREMEAGMVAAFGPEAVDELVAEASAPSPEPEPAPPYPTP